MRFGYVSQNLSLGVTTGHTLRLAGLTDQERVKATVNANLDALEVILRWNAAHDMPLFRISSQVVPFASHPDFPYDWEAEHGERLRRVGTLAVVLGVRLSMHPGQYIQPGSLNQDVRRRSIEELHYAARLLALLGGSELVIHVGGLSGDRQAAAQRFVHALRAEPDVCRFLALENDELLWSIEDVLPVARALNVPVVVDTFHHTLNPGALTLDEALYAAFPSWIRNPKVHLSSQDPLKRRGAHAWGVDEADLSRLCGALNGHSVDVMLEAKGKEKAVLALRESLLARTS